MEYFSWKGPAKIIWSNCLLKYVPGACRALQLTKQKGAPEGDAGLPLPVGLHGRCLEFQTQLHSASKYSTGPPGKPCPVAAGVGQTSQGLAKGSSAFVQAPKNQHHSTDARSMAFGWTQECCRIAPGCPPLYLASPALAVLLSLNLLLACLMM